MAFTPHSDASGVAGLGSDSGLDLFADYNVELGLRNATRKSKRSDYGGLRQYRTHWYV